MVGEPLRSPGDLAGHPVWEWDGCRHMLAAKGVAFLDLSECFSRSLGVRASSGIDRVTVRVVPPSPPNRPYGNRLGE